MTHKEFTSWLEGYLDAKSNSLVKKDILEIRNKLSEVNSDIQKIETPAMPWTTDTKPDKYQIICDAEEQPKGSADTGVDNVYKDEIK